MLDRLAEQFPINPAIAPDEMVERVKSTLARKLPRIGTFRPHDRVMSIAGGGPSLQDTWQELTGVIAAVNGSLEFLLQRGITPWCCAVMDPREHMTEIVRPHPDVFFILASMCHPRLFDSLAGCKVGIFHASGGVHSQAMNEYLLGLGETLVPGATTIGLRMVNVGYVLGFRNFVVHGVDSSYRRNSTHAYPDYTDGKIAVTYLDGFATSRNFIEQIRDAEKLRPRWEEAGIKVEFKGEGLFQHLWRKNAPQLRVRADDELSRAGEGVRHQVA